MRSKTPRSRRGSGEAALFGAVLAPRLPRADLLRLLPLALALHLLALGSALRAGRGPAAGAAKAGPEALVLQLLAAPGAASAPLPAQPSRPAARGAARPPRVPPAKPRPDVAPALDVAPAAPGPSRVAAPSSGLALPAGLAAGGTGGAAGHGAAGGIAGAPGSETAHLTAAQGEQLLEAYLEELHRRRFRRVRYPHQAAAAGITGLVSLRVVVGPYGEVRAVQRVGRCPHPVLCEGAEEAVRRASPFPPPPPELGTPLAFELPFRFFLY